MVYQQGISELYYHGYGMDNKPLTVLALLFKLFCRVQSSLNCIKEIANWKKEINEDTNSRR